MAGFSQLNRWLILAAAIVLFVTAAIHGTGYTSVSSAVAANSVKPSLASVVRALWLMFSAHLLVLGVVVVLAGWTPGGGRVVLACALIPAADTALLLRFAGLFVGTFALAAVTVLLVLGGALQWRREGPFRGT